MTLQLLAEEKYGSPRRRKIYEEKAMEDASAAAVKTALAGPK